MKFKKGDLVKYIGSPIFPATRGVILETKVSNPNNYISYRVLWTTQSVIDWHREEYIRSVDQVSET
jgi:hypothetical protein